VPDAAHLIDVRSAVPEEASAIAALGTGPIANKHAFIVESFSWRTVWGAYIEERIVGYAVWDRRFFGRPFLWLLGVDPAFRRRGIAARLLAAYERGCIGEPLFVSTNESNHPMHELL
jgi:GNAT superfamily N-acetyltransferase